MGNEPKLYTMQEIFSWDFILFHVHASGKGRINNKIKRNGGQK
jgi:hypothetical protein